MKQIQEIAKNANYVDIDNMKLAFMEMRKVPAHELHWYRAFYNVIQATEMDTKKAIALVQIEYDRRAAYWPRCLAIANMIGTGTVVLVAVMLGAYLAN